MKLRNLKAPLDFARLDAAVYALAWAVLAAVGIARHWNEDGYRDAYQHARVYIGILALAGLGGGAIFWRVRTVYASGKASVWRLALEGSVAAVAMVAVIEAAGLLCDYFAGQMVDGWWMTIQGLPNWLPEQFLKCGGFGAVVGAALWALNTLAAGKAPKSRDSSRASSGFA